MRMCSKGEHVFPYPAYFTQHDVSSYTHFCENAKISFFIDE